MMMYVRSIALAFLLLLQQPYAFRIHHRGDDMYASGLRKSSNMYSSHRPDASSSSSSSVDELRIEGEDSSVSSRPSHHGGRRRRGIDRGDMFKTFSMVTLGVALVAQAPSLMTPDTVLAAEDDQQLNPSSRVVDSSMEEKADDEVDVQEEISTSTLISAQKDVSAASSIVKEKEGKEEGSRLADFISGLAGGAASRASKELLLHPIDTIKTRLQYTKGDETPADLFKDLYDGVWPALIVGTPAGAAFFATKDVLKGFAKANFGSDYRELTTIGAVFLANLPYWAIRNPAEVIKTQQQTGIVNGTIGAIKTAVQDEGIAGLYRGYGSNVAYAFPTDAIKFVVYEALVKAQGRKLNPLESSICGSAASSVAQLLSTPLDVVRTRIMTQEQGSGDDQASILGCASQIAKEEGVLKLFSGLTPRLSRAFLSGLIQFGSYEFTKDLFKKGG